jgi:hypothetical protein
VRVRATPRTRLDAGKTGPIVWIRQDDDGTAVLCHVELDGDQPVYNVYRPDELEPEPKEGGP